MNTNILQTAKGSFLVSLAETIAAGKSPQWVQLLPVGKFSASDGRGPFFADNPDQIIFNTLKRAGSRKIPVDYDHQIDHATKNGQPGIAAGWITQLEARDDGIWGLVEWTDKASAYLSSKEYRYLSPVINYTKEGEVTTILRAALTNKPALELTALASEQESCLAEELLDTKARLEASLAEAAEAFKKEVQEKQVASMVHMAAVQGRILPRQREFATKLCSIDTGLFEEFVSMVAPNNLAMFKEFGYGSSEETEHVQALSETEQAVCKAMGHTHEEFILLGEKK